MTECCRDARCSGCRSDRRLVAIAIAAMVAMSTYGVADADHTIHAALASQPAKASTIAATKRAEAPASSLGAAIPAVTIRMTPLDLKQIQSHAFGD